MQTQYTVDYFIKKFEAIPEDKWTTRTYCLYDKRCAMGHCGVSTYKNDGKEADALRRIVVIHFGTTVSLINDGDIPAYQQPTPKQRILAALYDIKKMQEKDIEIGAKPEIKKEIRYVKVSVPESITEQTKELILQ